jgi:2'-5' RNA ligase
MRLFIESVLEPSALDEVCSVAERMRLAPGFPSGAVRWVKREALHLTLRFLGELDESRLPQLSGALASLEGRGGVNLHAVEIGSFGGRRPRVIWVGFAQDEAFEQLQDHRQRLGDALARVGVAADRGAYRPHLTLGRVRRQASRVDQAAIRAAVDAAAPLNIEMPLCRVALVESTLLKNGPSYRRLAMMEL